MIINPYKKGSRSAMALKGALVERGERVFILSRPPKNNRALIVNWGNSDWEYDPRLFKVVNPPSVLALMTNKLRFFNAYGHGDMVPQWTTSPTEAVKWGGRVVARQVLEGSGGAGIVIWDADKDKIADFPKAPLYVKYENKTHEYRVHMARGLRDSDGFHPLLVQRKIFQKTPDNPAPKDWAIRNHANGFIYVQNSGYPTPDCIVKTCQDFMKHFKEMHFAALDVVFHEKKGHAYILEGNTAPGLEGQTVSVYADYLQTLNKEAR